MTNKMSSTVLGFVVPS